MLSATLRCLLLRRPDVVIATPPQFFCGWAGVLTKWWYRLTRPFGKKPKFVLEIRDIWPESIGAVDAIGNPLVLRILEWMELRMYRAANHVVTVGPGYKRRLQERGVAEDKLSIVMNGVDRDLLEPRSQILSSCGVSWASGTNLSVATSGRLGWLVGWMC